MDSMSDATAKLFAAGFAVQRLIELLDPILFTTDPSARAWRRWLTKTKAFWSGLLSTLAGAIISGCGGLRIFHGGDPVVDIAVSALAIGAGTNGVNSVLKFAQYSKDSRSQDANATLAAPVRPPPTAAAAKVRSMAS